MHVLEEVLHCLLHIHNLSQTTGVFPDKIKLARVVVIFKEGDRSAMGNYRPVSILPILSKELEKIIHSRLSNFCETLSLLTDCQFGFRKHRSTEHALLVQNDFILNNLERKLLTLGIFVDFTKAFDHINHEIL